jgi:chorismate mutase
MNQNTSAKITTSAAAPARPAAIAAAAGAGGPDPALPVGAAPAVRSRAVGPLAGRDTTDGVLSGRERIDAIDAQITELIRHRIEVSREIQAARIAEGGRRVDLRRETEIIGRYTAALGRSGTAMAMVLLELGRGRS